MRRNHVILSVLLLVGGLMVLVAPARGQQVQTPQVGWFSTKSATIPEGGYSDTSESATLLRLVISPTSSTPFDVVVQWPQGTDAAPVVVEAVGTAPVDGTHNAPAANEAVIRVPANSSGVDVYLHALDDDTVNRTRTRTLTITGLRTVMSWTRTTTSSTPTNYDDPGCATTSTCSSWSANGGDAFTGAQIKTADADATVTVTEDDISYISAEDEFLYFSRPVGVNVPFRVAFTTGGVHNITHSGNRDRSTLGVPLSDVKEIIINTTSSLSLPAGSLAISGVGENHCVIRFSGDSFPSSCTAQPQPTGPAPHPKIYHPSGNQYLQWYPAQGEPQWAAVDAFWADFDSKFNANAASGRSWQECIPAETITYTDPAFGWNGWFGPKNEMPSYVDISKKWPAEASSGENDRWVGETETIAEDCWTVS